MSKTKRFEIESGEPSGTTFMNKPGRFAGDKQSKRAARFGLSEQPVGTTFEPDKSFINFPKADVGVKESKVISENGGQGSTYKAPRGGPKDFGGSVGVGTSAPKKGRTMSTKAPKVF
jgi:hypothetical protein